MSLHFQVLIYRLMNAVSAIMLVSSNQALVNAMNRYVQDSVMHCHPLTHALSTSSFLVVMTAEIITGIVFFVTSGR